MYTYRHMTRTHVHMHVYLWSMHMHVYLWSRYDRVHPNDNGQAIAAHLLTRYLASELRQANASALAALQCGLLAHWRAFVYDGGCAFELLLVELAARKHRYFEQQMPATANSATSFWSPARGAFELRTAKKVGPSWGAGAVAH